jgi:NADH:ubiquinone oxidoreductase subunit 2 (subunit N)
MISLGYYLRVVAAMWMQEPASCRCGPTRGSRRWPAGPSRPTPRACGATGRSTPSRRVFGAATLVLGIVPSPLFDLAVDAGAALGNLV